jgi:hypothetical protein
MTNGPETTQPTERDRYGYRIDGALVQFWGSKARAVAGAKAIGWPASSLTKVQTRFQLGYALAQTGGGLLTREAYALLLEA